MLEAIAILKWIEGNKWAKRALLVLLLVAVLLGAKAYYIHVGRGEGRQIEKQDTAKSIEQDRQEAKAQASASIGTANQQATQAQADAKAAGAKVDVALAGLADLTAAVRQQQAQLATLTDAQVRAANLAAVGRSAGDATAGYTAHEERDIAGWRVEAKDCDTRVGKATEAAQAAGAEADAQKRNAAAQQAKYDALRTYTFALAGDYAKLWNLNPPKKRAWKCLRAWKCGAVRLDVPKHTDPSEVP